MYLAQALLKALQERNSETQVGLSHLHVFAPKNPKIAYGVVLGFLQIEGMSELTARTPEGLVVRRKSLRNILPLATQHHCPGLENLHGTKIGCTDR